MRFNIQNESTSLQMLINWHIAKLVVSDKTHTFGLNSGFSEPFIGFHFIPKKKY